MGKTMMGTPGKQVGVAQMMTPEQQNFLKTILNSLGAEAQGAYSNLLKPYSEEMFQESVVDPAMQTYQQQMLPTLQQRFVDANASSSSALNQALSQSAGDMSKLLAGQRMDLQQNTSQRQLGGLQGLGGLVGSKAFDPIVQGPKSGLLKDLIQGLTGIGGGYLYR